MAKFEALIQYSNPGPNRAALGYEKGDIICIKPLGSQWSDAERRGQNMRVVIIETEDTDDDRAYARMVLVGVESVSSYPYQTSDRRSKLSVDLATADAGKVARGDIIKETDGYTRAKRASRVNEIG